MRFRSATLIAPGFAGRQWPALAAQGLDGRSSAGRMIGMRKSPSSHATLRAHRGAERLTLRVIRAPGPSEDGRADLLASSVQRLRSPGTGAASGSRSIVAQLASQPVSGSARCVPALRRMCAFAIICAVTGALRNRNSVISSSWNDRSPVHARKPDHGRDQHAADAKRRRLGRRVQPAHHVGQLGQPEGAHEEGRTPR